MVLSPAASDWNTASDGSTANDVPVRVTPAGRADTLTTDRTAPASTSDAPDNKSRVIGAASSATLAVKAAATTGASLLPVTVMVAVCDVAPPCPSTTS